MPDVFSKRKRSEVMARIRSRGNRDTELALARLLRQAGMTGWRRHVSVSLNRDPLKTLSRKSGPHASAVQRFNRSTKFTVRPDFVFPKKQVAIFVDGCFWHGCRMHSLPAKWLRKSSMANNPPSPRLRRTGRAFWRRKLTSNKQRDRYVTRQLRRQGWRVVRIWEHELGQTSSQRSAISRQRVVERIRRALR
jgi:DNA mismatch endonuclease (patch repair protein)